MQVFGIDAIVRIVSHFSFIYLAFWALRALRIENLFKAFKETQVRIVILMMAIALGFACSTFFLEIILLCKNIFLTFS
ncbi:MULTISPECIES: DUF1146 family protein [Enterococcus]|uniref:Integral membrane protein n=1 Tax=Enterococcus malodoratus ATCC 43197 TaxID=1158601 RepID=R2R6G3_9ENTE|nr:MULTISPECIES: DUF1146 family protein [Enterococcus]BBM19234.1 membrane protein [Enterococcus avium]EOH71559.1 hypothetical protein UAI_04513 [Enterococcus malodoratus ATCC 43197]EOT69751.1 hypothetical protein I585_01220 [Enterococcus malodoratus ATCC 43197]OJG63876.1 hypothetical protein RV07_GL000759 [Enterococcus malodoratus]SES86816.1 conserved hypothetical integral membrane protein [Enterococcus malodoratus]